MPKINNNAYTYLKTILLIVYNYNVFPQNVCGQMKVVQ